MAKIDNRSSLILYTYEDWLRMMTDGLSAKEAREEIEKDYSLTDNEKAELNYWMHKELDIRNPRK